MHDNILFQLSQLQRLRKYCGSDASVEVCLVAMSCMLALILLLIVLISSTSEAAYPCAYIYHLFQKPVKPPPSVASANSEEEDKPDDNMG